MSEARAWRVVGGDDTGKPKRLKIRFRWPDGVTGEFTRTQLIATIELLRMQGKRKSEYEEALAGLVGSEARYK